MSNQLLQSPKYRFKLLSLDRPKKNFFGIELILHDAEYTKGISYSSAPLLYKETKDKKTRNIVSKSDLNVTGQSTHKIEPGNAFQMQHN